MRPGTLLVDKKKYDAMGQIFRPLYLVINSKFENKLSIIGLGDFRINKNFTLFKWKEPVGVISGIFEADEESLRTLSEEEIYILEEDIKVEEKPEALAVIKAIKEKFNIVPIL